MRLRTAVILVLLGTICAGGQDAWARKKKAKKKKKKTNITKIIPAKEFTSALEKMAKDERVPVASSTLVEKGRGEGYYNTEKMQDNNLETFWAEGAKGWGKNQWVAFHLPDGTTHVEIVPGAGKEQFQNFNRPRLLFLDVYQVTFKRDEDTYKPKFKWLGRSKFKFQNKPQTVREKLSIKLPELVMANRTIYVGVLIIKKVYKGQFDDTSIAELRTSAVWGEH